MQNPTCLWWQSLRGPQVSRLPGNVPVTRQPRAHAVPFAEQGGLSCLLLPVCHRPAAVPGPGSALALTLTRDASSAEPLEPRPASSPRRHPHPAIWSR